MYFFPLVHTIHKYTSTTRVFGNYFFIFMNLTLKFIGLISNDEFKLLKSIDLTNDVSTYENFKNLN